MRYLRHVLTTAYGKGIILQRLLILLLLPVSVSFVTCLNVSKTEAASFQGLGDLDGGPFFSVAHGVSADGSVVVGWSASASGDEAFLCDIAHGMRSLREVLVDDYGLDLTGWTLTSATAISSDGLTIVGAGLNPSGNPEAWLARLDAPVAPER